VEEELRALFRQRHRVAANEPDSVQIRNLAEVAATRDASARTLSTLLAAVAAVSLLVGGIGVMNLLLLSVTQRTREVGLRMALGARRMDIARQFVSEAVVLSLIGGVLGAGLGMLAARSLEEFFQWSTVVSPLSTVIAIAVAAVLGVASGVYPASRAAQLDPIGALQHE
jgi:putative ABC transport system permease protein